MNIFNDDEYPLLKNIFLGTKLKRLENFVDDNNVQVIIH
jgi:hypothetical protein